MYSYDRIHKEKEKVDKSREKQYRLKKKKAGDQSWNTVVLRVKADPFPFCTLVRLSHTGISLQSQLTTLLRDQGLGSLPRKS